MGADAKRYRKLLRAFEQLGWRSRPSNNGGHVFLYCPCGEHTATFPLSPGDGRSWKNSVAQWRRTGCEFLPKAIQR